VIVGCAKRQFCSLSLLPLQKIYHVEYLSEAKI
jgi:hypothetical protein